MKLFSISDTRASKKLQWAIETPLGNLIPTLQLGSYLLNLSNVTDTIGLKDGGMAASWCYDEFMAECVICKSEIVLPEGMRISDHWVVFWRVQAKEVIKGLRFVTRWEENYRWNSGSPETGEGLDAQTWDDGLTEVSVGTEAPDYLGSRANRGDWFPKRYREFLDGYLLGRGIDTTEFKEDSLAVILPDLHSAEKCQIHFVIAWAPYSDESIATLIAVDQFPQKLLEGAGFV